MAEMETHHVVLALLLLIGVGIFYFRLRLSEVFETWRNRQRWHRVSSDEASGFHEDMAAGLSSPQFDLNHNILKEDTRSLDETAKNEIRRLMFSEDISFDKARLQYFQTKLFAHGIGDDGVPKDKKTVTF